MKFKKWDELGFLTGVDSVEKKEIIVKQLDKLFNIFTSETNKENFRKESTMIFPITVRIIKIIEFNNYRFNDFIPLVRERLFEFYKENDFETETHGCYSNMDYESLLISKFVEEFIKNDINKILK